MYDIIIKQLQAGKRVTLHPQGNSMTPKIKSGQKIVLAAATAASVGDIVLAKVAGRYYIHLVTATGPKGWQISNNHGHVNGWTRRIYGKVVEIG